MSVWSMNFSMMIGLAVGIDYSLFIVSRYREERAEGKDAIAAIENTMSTAGKAVFLSALTVVLSLAAVFLVPVMVFRSMALGMILSVVAVALAVAHAAPRACSSRSATRCSCARATKDPDIVAESRWARWTGVALRRPGTVLAIGLVVLGALVVPAFGMHLGMPGARVVDQGNTSRDGYDMLVVGVRARRRRARVHHRPRRRRADGRARSPPPTPASSTPASSPRRRRPGGSSCASPARPPSTTPRTATIVDTPARRARRPRCPTRQVGGPAAQNRDLTDVLTGRAPYAIGVILIVAFLLLLIVFRSLVDRASRRS